MKKPCCTICGEYSGIKQWQRPDYEGAKRKEKRHLILFKGKLYCFECLNLEAEIEAKKQAWEWVLNRPSSPVCFEDDDNRDGNRMIPKLQKVMKFNRHEIPYSPKEINNA